MGSRGRRTTNSSLDGNGWPGSADAFASRLWQPGHRTNDWPIERDSAFRLAPYKALIEKRSYTGPATVFGHDYNPTTRRLSVKRQIDRRCVCWDTEVVDA